MAKTLRRAFTTEADKAAILSSLGPRDDIMRTDATDFMTNAIAKNAPCTQGKVVSVKDVKRETVEESDLA